VLTCGRTGKSERDDGELRNRKEQPDAHGGGLFVPSAQRVAVSRLQKPAELSAGHGQNMKSSANSAAILLPLSVYDHSGPAPTMNSTVLDSVKGF
jgi:hypothetical protein